MGQGEVLEVLKKNPDKWFTSEEISQMVGVTRSSIGSSLKRLFKHNFICRERKRGSKIYNWSFIYKSKEKNKGVKKGV